MSESDARLFAELVGNMLEPLTLQLERLADQVMAQRHEIHALTERIVVLESNHNRRHPQDSMRPRNGSAE